MVKFNTSYLKILLAAIIWGSSGAFIKYIDLHPYLITFFRTAVPVVLIGSFSNWKDLRTIFTASRLMFFASLLNAVRLIFYFIGFTYAPIGNAVIILYTWPVFALVLSRIYLKEPLPPKNIVLLIISMIGIGFIYIDKEIAFDNEVFLGMLAMLFSSFIYALTVIIFKKESPNFSNWSIVFHQNFVGAVLFTIIFITFPEKPDTTQSLVSVVYAVLIGIAGYGLFFSALRKIKASSASFIAYIEVVSGIMFGVFLFNETLTWNVILGGLLIIGSSILLKK